MSLNLDKNCRTCLCEESSLLSIQAIGSNGTIASMLYSFVKTKPSLNNILPQKVCFTCYNDIIRCYYFKQKVESSQWVLSKLLCVEECGEEDGEPLIVKCRDKNTQTESDVGNSNWNSENEVDPSIVYELPQDDDEQDDDEQDDDGELQQYDGEMQQYDGEVQQYDSGEMQQYDGEMQLYDGEMQQYDGEMQQYDGEMQQYDGEMQLYDGEMQQYVGEMQQYDGEMQQYDQLIDKNDEQIYQNDEEKTEYDEDIKSKESRSSISSQPTYSEPCEYTKAYNAKVSFTAIEISKGENIKKLNIPKRPNGEDEPVDPAIQAKLFSCPRCMSEFSVYNSLEAHLKANLCKRITYKCFGCYRAYSTEEGLKRHQAKKKHRLRCSECVRMFSNENKLSEHLIKEHNRKIPSPNTFVRIDELQAQSCKPNGLRSYACDQCDKSYAVYGALTVHKLKHTGERPYACESCSMRFSTISILNNHRRTHSGEKPNTCHFCRKAFTQKSDCDTHMRTHTGARPYQCLECGETFGHVGSLRGHDRKHQIRK